MIDLAPKLMFQVMHDCARGSVGLLHSLTAETIERFGFEMLAQSKHGLFRQKCITVMGERVIDPGESLMLFFAHQ